MAVVDCKWHSSKGTDDCSLRFISNSSEVSTLHLKSGIELNVEGL